MALSALAFTVFRAPRLVCSMVFGFHLTLEPAIAPTPLDRGKDGHSLATVQAEQAGSNDPERRRATQLTTDPRHHPPMTNAAAGPHICSAPASAQHQCPGQ